MGRIGTLIVMLALTSPASALDQTLYAELLQRHTREVTDTARVRVDYRALRGNTDWKRLVVSVESTDPDKLGSRAAKIAFWSNAYNILAIDTVVRNYPLESIRDVGSFFRPVWGREAGTIGGRAISLGEIEHEILRPMGDPRIHAAIVCASISCPPLHREPFTAKRLEAQLGTALRTWLAEPRKGLRIDRGGKTVYLSKVFDWFEEDFESAGGVLAFIARYVSESDRLWLERNAADLDVEYLDYDWDLNELVED